MCLEKQSISAPLGDGTSATLNQDRPILRVDDPRLMANDPMMQRRRKVLAALGKNFPMAFAMADVQTYDLKPPYLQGDYTKMRCSDGTMNSCSVVNNFIMQSIGASGGWGYASEGVADASTGWKVKNPQDGWVKYAPGRLPSVGDVFLLTTEIAPGVTGTGHCGVVCQASLDPNEFWLTGDGGQPDRTGDLHQTKAGYWVRSYYPAHPDNDYPPNLTGDPKRLQATEAAYLVPRKLDCGDPQNPLISNFYIGGGGETLKGWRNVAHPKIFFRGSAAYDDSGSQQDFENFKALILKVDASVKEEAKWRAMYKPETI
jgi:hypothetical protein